MRSPRARARTARALVLAPMLAALAGSSPVAALSADARATIAGEAARLSPPDLARQLERNAAGLTAGARGPCPRAAGQDLIAATAATLRQAMLLIEGHRTFAELAQQLGTVASCLADLEDPARTPAGAAARWAGDYARYFDSASRRFALVFYGFDARLESSAEVSPWLSERRRRAAGLHPRLDSEYRRIGYASGLATFDDRSTAYATSQLAFNYAVNDAAQAFRYVWLRAGGADPRRNLTRLGRRVIALPRAAAKTP